MGIPALTWNTQESEGVSPAEIDPILYNNAYVYDTSPASPIDGVPVELFKKTRQYTYNAGSGTEDGSPGNPAPYYSTSYTSTNPHHNNMVVIKGGVYEKAEFTTCTSGGTTNPTAGVSYGNNVVFVDTGSSSPLVYGPIIAYSTGDSPQLGANIEANVGWVATTVNATAGIHTNNFSSVAGSYSPSSPSYAGIPLNLDDISWSGTYGSYTGTQAAGFPGVSAVSAPNISVNYSTSALSPAGGTDQPASSSPVSVTGSSGSKRVEFWAPGVSSASPTSSYLRGGVEFEIAKDKKYKIKPLSALTVNATASVTPFGVGGGRTGNNKDINTTTHCKATINTIGLHNLADANNRVHITGSSQVQLNGWHYVHDVTDANTFSIVVPLSQDSGTTTTVTEFTVETYDGIDKPGGVFKTPLTVDYVDEVNLFSSTSGYHSNGDYFTTWTSTQKYNYHTTKPHGFSAGDSFTTSPSSGSDWLGTKTILSPTGSHNFDVLVSSGTSSGSPSTTRRYTGSFSISGPTKGTVRAGGNAGNENVIMSHDTTLEAGGQYQYYPNSSFSNVVYADVECGAVGDSDSSMFKLMGLEIDADTGRLHSNGAFDGVNNKGVRSLDSFYPKFLEAREGALNSTITTGSVTQSNNSIILDDVERLPAGHLKTFTYSNGFITRVVKTKAFTLEYANGTSYTRSGVEVENDIGSNTYTDTSYTLIYVDTTWPVVNSSAHFMLEKQNNTPIVSGTSIIAYVGPDEGFHIPVWSSIKASKKTSHLGSGHTTDTNDYKYQDFCIKVYKSLNADRDDFITVYSDPDNESEPIDANTAYTYVSGTQIEGQFANGDNIVTDINTPVTNSQHLANTYANGSVRHF